MPTALYALVKQVGRTNSMCMENMHIYKAKRQLLFSTENCYPTKLYRFCWAAQCVRMQQASERELNAQPNELI